MATIKTQAEFDAALAALNGQHGYIDYGSATVTAYGSATVGAYDSATVRATPNVAVHLHSACVNVEGGVVIDVTQVSDSAEAWLTHHGVEVTDGKAILYKAVDDNLASKWAFTYPIGGTVTDHAWRNDNECGGGLHFCPWPWQALAYFEEATATSQARNRVDDIRIIAGSVPKMKARTARVLHEVDIDGNVLAVSA